jgi:hypothetical protein
MALRVLLVLTTVAVLYSCGQASSPVEKQEKREGAEQVAREENQATSEPTAAEAASNIPIDAVLGEAVETPSFDWRVIDVFETDHYYYLEDPSVPIETDAISKVGKFVVVTYSMRNTSAQTVTANLGATLHVTIPDGKTEIYEESEVTHPYSGAIWGGPELAPRGLLLGQFIFDVPVEVEPEFLIGLYQDDMDEPRGEAGNVDLTEEEPTGPGPDEIYALQMEYFNMGEYDREYALFAQESKDRVSEQEFVSGNKREDQKYGRTAFTEYSFPSVKIEGDRATLQIVRSWSSEDDEGQVQDTQEAVLEDEGWRIVMRGEQYKAYGG